MLPFSHAQVNHLLRRIFGRVRYEVEGLEHVPQAGPGLIIMNHTGWEEILLTILSVPRPLRIMGMRELMFLDDEKSLARLFDTAYARNFGPARRSLIKLGGRLLGARLRDQLREMGYIPTRVFAENWRPILGCHGIREAVQSLTAGELVLIFPEGGYKRDGVMYPFKRGLALMLRLLARRGIKVPVIPAAQHTANSISLTLGNRYIPYLVIGPPMVFTPGSYSTGDFDQTIICALQDQVTALLSRAWVDYPPQNYAQMVKT
jgi:1-acyl-sn-glycerol-3-phosphate acyltransferase